VHQSIAGPIISSSCEEGLVRTSYISRSGKRVAFAPWSRRYVSDCRRRNDG